MAENTSVKNEFVGLEPVTKTIRNELRPTELTRKHLKESGLLEEDRYKQEQKDTVTDLLDEYLREELDKALGSVSDIEWDSLFDAMQTVEDEKKESAEKKKENYKKLRDVQAKKRQEIYEKIKGMEACLNVTGMNTVLHSYITSHYTGEEQMELLSILSVYYRFGGYFDKYFSSRKTVFLSNGKKGAVCTRIVHENAEAFLKNIRSFQYMMENMPEEVAGIEGNELSEYLDGWTLKQIFCRDYYNEVLIQKGIDYYNMVVGFVNKHMSEYCQKKKLTWKCRMSKLSKQILSIASSVFKLPFRFEEDEEVYLTVNGYIDSLKDARVVERCREIARNAVTYDWSKIFICGDKNINDASACLTGRRHVIENCLEEKQKDKEKAKKKPAKKEPKKGKDKKVCCSLEEINQILLKNGIKANASACISDITSILAKAELESGDLYAHISIPEGESLKDNGHAAKEMQRKLSSYKDMVKWMQRFLSDDLKETDPAFYEELNELYDTASAIKQLFDKVQHYATQKLGAQRTVKMNYGSPELCKGWAKSKEYSHNAVLLERNGLFYLVIFNKDNKPDKLVMDGTDKQSSASDFRRMEYHTIPSPEKMVPKCFIATASVADKYGAPQYLRDNEVRKKAKKANKDFDLEICRDLIDYYKKAISQYPAWDVYTLQFRPTEEYEDVNDFFKDIADQGYAMKWKWISEEQVKKLEEENSIFLFQIYNKDFSPKSKGRENIHTTLFKAVFGEENQKARVLKLNGGVEIAFRDKEVLNPVIHEKGSILVNRLYQEMVNGKEVQRAIPEAEYMEIYNYLNGRIGSISESARQYLEKTGHFETAMQIVKDRRYTIDKMTISIPVTINYRKEKNDMINDIALKKISETDDLHIIGIDRGERNLLYVTEIDLAGNIMEQYSLNTVNGCNYQAKLVAVEKKRIQEKRDWEKESKIVDLKNGYLSCVIHELAEKMRDGKAVIVMEGLNVEFKNGRKKIERQVYQRFEDNLMSKFSYLTFKDRMPEEDGGILNGLQYARELKVSEMKGTQNGMLLYVNPAYTTRIDPVTGFANIINFGKYETNKDKKEFLQSFDYIGYDPDMDMFRLEFDFRNFETYKNHNMPVTKWTAYTNDTRIERIFENGKWRKSKEIDLTESMKDSLALGHIQYSDGHNLLDDLAETSKDAAVVKGLFHLIKLTFQLQNCKGENDDPEYDRLISPVMKDGVFFDSKKYKGLEHPELPQDTDANGAYCIALKGLMLVNTIRENWQPDADISKLLTVSNEDWFTYLQK